MTRICLRSSGESVDPTFRKKVLYLFILPVPISDTSLLAEKAKAMKQSLQGNSAN